MDQPLPELPAALCVGVWIDHRRAHIVRLTQDRAASRTVLSHVEKHAERSGDSPMKGDYEALQVPADDRRQRALTAELNGYYDTVLAGLQGCGALLVFGPGEAKGELQARLALKHPAGPRVVMRTEGRMTHRQVVAAVRTHFGVGAARLQPPTSRGS